MMLVELRRKYCLQGTARLSKTKVLPGDRCDWRCRFPIRARVHCGEWLEGSPDEMREHSEEQQAADAANPE